MDTVLGRVHFSEAGVHSRHQIFKGCAKQEAPTYGDLTGPKKKESPSSMMAFPPAAREGRAPDLLPLP